MTATPEHIQYWLYEHGYCPVTEVRGGGSDASLLLAKRNSGGAAVVKWARVARNQVDGHGPDALVRKALHHIWLRRNAEWFANAYPRLLLMDDEAGSFTVTDYIAGQSLEQHIIAYATGSGRQPRWTESSLMHGYLLTVESGLAAGVGQFRAWHWPAIDSLRRVERRLSFISRIAGEKSADAAGCWRRLDRLISSSASSPLTTLADLVSPAEPVRGFPLHGDLNLSNVLVTNSGALRHYLIDPAGIRRWRDPAYDIAKALVHLALIMPAKLSIGTRNLNEDVLMVLRRMAIELLELASVRRSLAMRSVVRRLVGYYVCHILSEAACRVSLAVQGQDLAGNLTFAQTYLAAGQTALRGLPRAAGGADLTVTAAVDGVVLPSIEQGMSVCLGLA